MTDVVDRPSTPEESTALSAAQTKLNEMLGGAGNAPAAPRPTGPPAHIPSAVRGHPGARVEDGGTAQPPAVERELAALRQNPKLYDENDPEQPQLAQRLRQLVAASATSDERAAVESAPLADHRAYFGVEPPTLPPTVLANYEEKFAGWERDFLVDARQHGLANDLVRDLRDDGVQLGMQVDGKPLAEATLDHALAKYGTRLTADQRGHLKAYWRRIEGGVLAAYRGGWCGVIRLEVLLPDDVRRALRQRGRRRRRKKRRRSGARRT